MIKINERMSKKMFYYENDESWKDIHKADRIFMYYFVIAISILCIYGLVRGLI